MRTTLKVKCEIAVWCNMPNNTDNEIKLISKVLLLLTIKIIYL